MWKDYFMKDGWEQTYSNETCNLSLQNRRESHKIKVKETKTIMPFSHLDSRINYICRIDVSTVFALCSQ